MINIEVLDVVKAVGGVLVGNPNIFIKGVSIDSRKIDANNLYIPIIGEKNDGHDYIDDVIKKHVACVLVQEDHPRPTGNVSYIIVEDTFKALQDLARYYINLINPYVIAVTGSNGKTSAKDMLCAIMSKKYKTAKTSGNHNNEIGVPLSILEFDKDIKCAVIEMGVEHKGDIDALCEIVQPDVSLITFVGSAHMLNFNNSIRKIADAKLEIYRNLKRNGYMFYNNESEELEAGLRHIKDSTKPCFGFGEGSELTLSKKIKFEDGYTVFNCSAFNDPIYIKSLGRHQAMNALGCIGIGLKEGISKEDIIDALKNMKFEKMRCELVKYGDSFIIDDSYKSNPESVHAALDVLKQFENYNKVVCLSDMLELGSNEIKMHEEIGSSIKRSKAHFDLICTGELSQYTAEAGDGKWFETKKECADYLKKYKYKKAVILIKGSRATGMDEVVKLLKKGA